MRADGPARAPSAAGRGSPRPSRSPPSIGRAIWSIATFTATRPESALGRGLHVRRDVARLRLRRVRHRRLRAADRRLARVGVAAHRLRARCARASDLRPLWRRRRTAWSITAIAARSICRCATPIGSADAGIAPSVGSRGDSYDNALAESVIGLFKTEVIRRQGPVAASRGRGIRDARRGSIGSITRRLLEPIGYVPPAEYEARYYEQAARPDSTNSLSEIPGTIHGAHSDVSCAAGIAARLNAHRQWLPLVFWQPGADRQKPLGLNR